MDESTILTAKFDPNGLLPCITQSETGTVLMMAWMNEEALQETLNTGQMHYWSRSRQELWHKGATSGDIQHLIEIRIDCDQDCILAIVKEPKAACHTGRKTCFYRKIVSKNQLEFITNEKTA